MSNNEKRYERQKEQNKVRKTYQFITKADPTPQALKKATYQGMMARKKEREQKKSANRRKAIRTSAAAAVLVAAVAATPLRGTVVHAASDVYQAIVSNWREDVFPVNLKQSDNGCTVEIIESRVANDFLYLTVKEYYPKDLVSRDEETKLYTMPDISYSGSIKDNKGNEVTFAPDNVMYLWAVGNDHMYYTEDYEGRNLTQSAESAADGSDEFVVNAQYRIYLPEMSSVVNSSKKKYTCTVDAVSQQLGSQLNFDFPLDNTTEAINNKRYELNRTFPLNGADVTFQTLAFSPSGADLIVRIDPSADLSENAVKDFINNFDASVYVRNDEDIKKQEAWAVDSDREKLNGETYGFAWLYNDRANNHGYVYDLDEDINADSMMWDKDRCMKLGGSYYCIVSDFADQPSSSYDMEKVTRSDFTVEIEYLRWRSQSYQGTEMLSHYDTLDDITLTAEKTGTGSYSFSDNHIKLPGNYGDLNITLKNISETKTTKLKDGSYRHTLNVNADIAFSDWDDMMKGGVWENISLVNSEGKEVVNVGLNIDNFDRNGTDVPVAVKCVVTDNNKHFTLSDSDLTLHVANVIESLTYDPTGWFNPNYSSENVELLNEQKYFHVKSR